ncbi:MAG TPA: class II D-tagatose-bisphosphate aldolase, non-catalytic subunit [Terriglobales bacterium]|jgi:D-tagatose-1,6-bisphosphate aldolase subunit GatZ/KbaZ|nr:class II D-tagatose-bisphosphate aldolase, non-catalytic subunit [Terriglobales bacterium]
MPECAAVADFKNIIERNRGGEPVGTYAVCSSHPWVLESAIRQAVEDGSLLHLESTSSQVNQFGGYSGQTPRQFAETVWQAARKAGLPAERVLLGADHLGPYPWRGESPDSAMEKACELASECVLAGYQKVHLDASMSCGGDPTPLEQGTIAERAAILCTAAEHAARQLPPGSAAPVYVIGTEVPTPGGEVGPGQPPAVTTTEDMESTLAFFESAFGKHGLSAAWERVVGLVVQPGVEFGDAMVWDYDPQKAQALSAALPSRPKLVYEAHSTDYQRPSALARMVKDHFAILKVGPALTFAFREAVFALSAMERELLGSGPATRLSRVREELEAAMLRNPIYWQPYYHGDPIELKLARAFSLSDRCRYYWHEAAVQKELDHLLANLAGCSIALGLLSQYLPLECEAARRGALKAEPSALIHHHIQAVLETYATACGPANLLLPG